MEQIVSSQYSLPKEFLKYMAVEETTTTRFEDNSGRSDIVRKIVAAVVGLIVIILIVLAARWIGDRVRERFFPGTITPTPTPIISPIPTGYVTLTPSQLPSGVPTGVPTYSHIPATGPEDYAYVIVGLMALGGVGALSLAKKK